MPSLLIESTDSMIVPTLTSLVPSMIGETGDEATLLPHAVFLFNLSPILLDLSLIHRSLIARIVSVPKSVI